ncbi:uncharacterized protein LOC141907073 [Tubulanus polymorphus]|uniref:uncharacterized protein LOC141907073 n=1 Tax=Tubulanus polymorphus TaxID=672921 RepID=UPI003DA67742
MYWSFTPITTARGLCELPDELCARIFSYLHPVSDALPGLSFVCRKWRNILQNTGTLWRTIHIDPANYELWHFSVIVSIFRTYGHHIQKLTWKENAVVYESVFALIPKLVNLRCVQLPVLWTPAVLESLSSLRHLEQIHVNGGFVITDTELKLISKSYQKLKILSLNACWSVTATGVTNLVASLPELQQIKLKVNSGLRLNDVRSERAMEEGWTIVDSISDSNFNHLLTVLCLHFVPVELDELWEVVSKLPCLKKLSISNCERLHGIRLISASLQKIYLFNIWGVLFVSITAGNLRHLTIDHGMESMEHLEVFAPRLRRVFIDGGSVLRAINIRSERLAVLELFCCDNLDMRSLRETLINNPTILSLKVGQLSTEDLSVDEICCPNIQEFSILDNFSCRTLLIRSPTLRVIHNESENDLSSLSHMYVVADHICKVALVGIPNLRTLVIQCSSVDSIELNLCSDDQICLESCVIQAFSSIGFLRLFDCRVNMLSVSTPLAKTVVLYRCSLPDYVLQMALKGCPNISHLNLEKSSEFSELNLQAPPMKYLNLFGCNDVIRVDLDCPELLALNLGQCPNVSLFFRGSKYDITNKSCQKLEIIKPNENLRWTHGFPPEVYMNR